MTRRFLLTALGLLIAMASSAGTPDAAAADPSVFMSEMWKRTVEILGKKASQTERLARFRELFQADFDGPGIARELTVSLNTVRNRFAVLRGAHGQRAQQ